METKSALMEDTIQQGLLLKNHTGHDVLQGASVHAILARVLPALNAVTMQQRYVVLCSNCSGPYAAFAALAVLWR
jgi:hypothetical protein